MFATILFYLFAGVAIGGALGVVLAKSPVASLLMMIVSLGAVSGTYVLMEAHFLAAVQIIVYAGAIMVLFMFVIMLLNLGHEYERDVKMGAFAVVSFAVVGLMAGLLATRFGGIEGDGPAAGAIAIDAALVEHGAVGAIAQSLFTDYVVPFEITGILLLVAIVGALALAKRNVA